MAQTELPPAQNAPVPIAPLPAKDELMQHMRDMLYIRHFEERCNRVYREGKAGGYMHVYIGMEALAVGWMRAIRQGHDTVITAYRDHAHALLLGTDPAAVLGEVMGRSIGTAAGKGGSMHIFDTKNGFFGGWGIVGGHIPLAAGIAFAAKYHNQDKVTICFLGDGAANQGVVFETLNMAGLYDLPIIFVIENNEFAMGTRLEYHAADPHLSKRGEPFGIHSERLDGMDVVHMKADAERIVKMVREEKRPAWIEVMTYRYSGHGAADNDRQLYRTKEEEAAAWERDPIGRLKKQLMAAGQLTEEEYEKLDGELIAEVEKVYEAADASPFPNEDEVYDNIYTDMTPEKGH